MSLDGKLGILIVTMGFLFLIYLDNAGKLAPALALITGPVMAGAAPITDSSAGLAPMPVTPSNVRPSGPSGPTVLPNITGIAGQVTIPPASLGPLPGGG